MAPISLLAEIRDSHNDVNRVRERRRFYPGLRVTGDAGVLTGPDAHRRDTGCVGAGNVLVGAVANEHRTPGRRRAVRVRAEMELDAACGGHVRVRRKDDRIEGRCQAEGLEFRRLHPWLAVCHHGEAPPSPDIARASRTPW